MKKPTVRIYTGSDINDFIDREMTNEEFAQYKIDQANMQAQIAEAEAKAQAKIELLDRLGITEDEVKLLFA